jgi:hypothetical protein
LEGETDALVGGETSIGSHSGSAGVVSSGNTISAGLNLRVTREGGGQSTAESLVEDGTVGGAVSVLLGIKLGIRNAVRRALGIGAQLGLEGGAINLDRAGLGKLGATVGDGDSRVGHPLGATD